MAVIDTQLMENCGLAALTLAPGTVDDGHSTQIAQCELTRAHLTLIPFHSP